MLGSGGREHALAKSLRNSASCGQLWCAPGNPGIAAEAELVSLNITDPAQVVDWCNIHKPTLIVVGPEQPLVAGVTNALRASGFSVFGPSQEAAQLESSKGFAKDFMQRYGIPTASYQRCTNLQMALEYLSAQPLPVVVKYDGLAAGKGVVVATSMEEAERAVRDMFNGTYGNHGVVIESFLEGVEASIFAVTDGSNYVTLAPSHDYKRIGDHDTGKNTGGMGAVAPSPRVTPSILSAVENLIISPTLQAMKAVGMPFVGCLYCGVMIDSHGNPSVVEFNARFGDPETQAVLSVLDADVAALFASAARGNLNPEAISSTSTTSAVCVVLASGGYPDQYTVGYPILGLDQTDSMDNIEVFHAGTINTDGLRTSGGRVLGVTALAPTIADACDAAYQACSHIHFTDMYFRTDIGS